MLKRRIAALTVCTLIFSIFQTTIPGLQTIRSSAAQTSYNVVSDFGANGTDKEDDTEFIQSALDMAVDSDSVITVTIPKGTYYIGSRLKIYSNTYLKLESGATLKRTNDSDYLLFGSNDSYDGNGADYGLTHDITIDGGTWDGNVSDTTKTRGLIKIHNSKNVTIKNAVFTKCCGTHFVLLTGVSGVSVTDCTFSNFIEYTGTAESYTSQILATLRYRSVEALHIDYDDTNHLPSENVAVSGCLFQNVMSGVGTHHVYDDFSENNFIICGNKFINCYYYAINTGGFTNFSAYDNTATNCGGFIYAQGTSGNVYSNTFSGKTNLNHSFYSYDFTDGDPYFHAVRIVNNSDLTFTDNVVRNSSGHGIYVNTGSKAVIGNSTVSGSAQNGIFLSSAGTSSITGCTITNAASAAISVKDTSMSSISNNTIDSPSGNGIYLVSAKVTSANGNAVLQTGKNAVYMSASQGVFKNNAISDAGSNGFYIQSGSKLTASGNVVSGCSSKAFLVSSCTSVSISSNTIYGCKSYSLYVKNKSTGIVFKNNVMDKCGVYVESGSKTSMSGNTPFVTAVTASSVYTCTAGAVRINWTKVAGASGYRIYKYDSASGTWKKITTIKDGSVSTYRISGLKSGTTYKFKVKAYVKYDGTNFWGEASSAITASTKPAKAAIGSVSKTSSAIRLNWKKTAGASGYQIQRYKSGKWVTVKTITSGSTLTYRMSGFSGSTSYKFRIRAYRKVNAKTLYGDWSTSVTVKTKA